MNHFLRRGICLGAWVAGCGMAHAQLAAMKTNALLWGNLTPNISMELVTASKFSLEGTVFYGLNKTPLDAQLKGAQRSSGIGFLEDRWRVHSSDYL